MKVQIKKLISSVLALAMTASLFTTSLVSAAPILPMHTITDYKSVKFTYNSVAAEWTFREIGVGPGDIYLPSWSHGNSGNKVVMDLSSIAENYNLVDDITLTVNAKGRNKAEKGTVQKFKLISAPLPTNEDGGYITYDEMYITKVENVVSNNIMVSGEKFDPNAENQKNTEYEVVSDSFGNGYGFSINFDVKDWVDAQFADSDTANDVLSFTLFNVGYDDNGNEGYVSKHSQHTGCDSCADITTFYKSRIDFGNITFSLNVTYIDESVVKAQELVDLKADIAAGNQTAVDSKLAEIWGSDDYYYKKYQDLNNKEPVHSAILATEEFWQLKKSVKTAVISQYDAENVLTLNKKVYTGMQNVGINSGFGYAFTGIKYESSKFVNQGREIITGEWGAVKGLKFAYNLTSLQDTKEFIKYVGFTPAQGIGQYKTTIEPITAGMAEGGAVVPATISAKTFSEITDRAQLINETYEPLATDPSAIPTQHIWDRDITAEQDRANGEIITFDTVDITEDFTSKIDDGIASYIFWLVNRDRKSTGYYDKAVHANLTVEYVSAPELFETGTTEKKVKYLSLVDADLATTYASLADTMKAVVDEHIINSTATDMQTLVDDVKALISSDSVALPLIKEAISSEDTEEIKSYIQLIMGGKSYEFARYEGCADAVNAALAEVNNDDLTTEIFAATVKAAVADAMTARKAIKETFVYQSNITAKSVTKESKAFYFTMEHNWGKDTCRPTTSQMYTGQYNLAVGHKVLLDLREIEADKEFIKYASIVPMIQAWGFNSEKIWEKYTTDELANFTKVMKTDDPTKVSHYEDTDGKMVADGSGNILDDDGNKTLVYEKRPEQLNEGEAVKGFVVPSNIPEGATYDSVLADFLVGYKAESGILTTEDTQSSTAAIPTQHIATKEQAEAVEARQNGVDMTMDVVDITADLKAKLESKAGVAAYNFWLAPGKEIPAGFTGSLNNDGNWQYWSKILTNNNQYEVYIEYVTEDEFIANVQTSANTEAYVEFVLTDSNANVWAGLSDEVKAEILAAAKGHNCATFAEFRTMVNNLVKAKRDTDIVLTDIEANEKGYSVSITNNTADVKPMFVVAAAYGENNKMLASVIYSEEGNIVEKIDGNGSAGFTFAFDGVDGIKEIKVFCWADAATIKPYGDAKTYTVSTVE